MCLLSLVMAVIGLHKDLDANVNMHLVGVCLQRFSHVIFHTCLCPIKDQGLVFSKFESTFTWAPTLLKLARYFFIFNMPHNITQHPCVASIEGLRRRYKNHNIPHLCLKRGLVMANGVGLTPWSSIGPLLQPIYSMTLG